MTKEAARGGKGLGLYQLVATWLGQTQKGGQFIEKKHRMQELAVFLQIILSNLCGVDNTGKSTV